MLQKESLQAAIEKSQRQQTASDARHEQDDGDALAEVEAARKEMAAASALLFVERERRSAAEAAREKAQQRADAAQQRLPRRSRAGVRAQTWLLLQPLPLLLRCRRQPPLLL